MKSYLTSFGMPGIGIVPYGVHLCHFYPGREELVDGLVPYFLAGLGNDERCIWIGSSPLPANEIRAEIAKSAALEQGVTSGQLTVLDENEWYGEPATLHSDEVIKRWIVEEERALAQGFVGLRVAGNMSFVPKKHWHKFMDYEQKLHEGLKNRRIVCCCSYARDACRPVDLLEVVSRHDGALDRSETHWQVYFNPPIAVAL